MTSRLPDPGSDDGVWGEVLNDFLTQSHNSDGTLKDGAVGTGQLAANSVTSAKVADGALPQAKVVNLTTNLAAKYTLPGSGIPEADLSSAVQTKLNSGGGGGVTDHGALTGLSDDDHPQYHNNARGDARYYTQTQLDTSLAAKADDSAAVHKTGTETIAGVKTFSSSPVVPDGSFTEAKVTNLTSDLAAKADDSATVHKTGTETIAGVKTFSSSPVVPDGSFTEAKVTNLTSDLAAKATDASVVHLAGVETITGAKTFSAAPTVPTPTASTDATTKAYVDTHPGITAPVVLTHTGGVSINIDASLSHSFRITLVGNPTFAIPTNPTDGQMIVIEMAAGASARTITLTTGSSGAFEYTKTVPASPAPIVTASKTGFLGIRYSSSTSRWHALAFEAGA